MQNLVLLLGVALSFVLGSLLFELGKTAKIPPRELRPDAAVTQNPQPSAEAAEVDLNVDNLNALDVLREIPGVDDFTRAEERNAADKRRKGPTADEKLQLELEAMREAEAKVQAQAAKAEAKAQKNKRKMASKRAAENARNQKNWDAEARRAAEELPGISREELDWEGLE